MDGGSRGVGSAAAAGHDDDSWRDADAAAGGGGFCACDVNRLLVAVVGVGVAGGVARAVCVVIEGGVAVGAIEVADPDRRPPLIWAAGH